MHSHPVETSVEDQIIKLLETGRRTSVEFIQTALAGKGVGQLAIGEALIELSAWHRIRIEAHDIWSAD